MLVFGRKIKGRWPALVLAATLLLGSVGLSGTRVSADDTAPAVVTTAAVGAGTVDAGGAAPITVNIEMTQAADLLVDVEIFDPQMNKVHQSFIDNIAVEAGVARSLPFAWQVPSGTATGTYTISIGIFGAGWNGMYDWHAGAATLQVGAVSGDDGGNPALPAPGGLTAAAASDAVTLGWSAVSGVSGYDVEADGAVVAQVAAAAYTHSGLTPDSAHSYRVRAVDGSGAGAWSAPLAVRTALAPGSSPVKMTVKTGTSASTQMISPEFEFYNVTGQPIALSSLKLRYYFTINGEKPLAIGFWATTAAANVTTRFVKMPIPSAAADYYLEIGFTTDAGQLNPGAKAGVYTWINKEGWTSFTQTDDYSFTNSAAYAETSRTPVYVNGAFAGGSEPELLDMPAFPENVAAVPSDTSVTLTWDAVADADSYEVLADGTLNENVQTAAFTDAWLKSGTRHTYQVRSRKGETVSLWSQPLTLKTTGQQNLPAPTNVRATTSEQQVALSWNAVQEEITGYELEVDGQLVDNGLATTYTHSGLTGGTPHTYRVRAKDGATSGAWSELLKLNTVFTPTGPFHVSFTVNPDAERAPISPYIYGTNDDLTDTEGFTARRIGGNRLSTYNWENNASNAGTDWMQSSDGFVPWFYGGVPTADVGIPGIGITAFHEKSLQKNAYSLITLPTAGYVANDLNGPVDPSEKAPSSRWVEVKPAKGAPFSLTPDLNDHVVYEDELVNLLVSKFGDATTPTGIHGYEIDNEPGLWNDTHPLMHPDRPGSAEVLNKGIALAKAVKAVDPAAEMFGPVSYGLSEMLNMQASDDWNTLKGNYAWYVDYYLDKMRVESQKAGERLLDVFDLHWYPEITGGGIRITRSDANDNVEANKARIQAPRSLWDPSYTENSWIGTWYSAFLPLIPRVQQSIDAYNPGTKLAITEYNYGGESHVSGGMATADVLGIFGKYGVYLGGYWKMVNNTSDAPYTSAGFKIYNNYDGTGAKYGDTKVQADTSDIENSSIYGSVFKDSNNKLHVIVINKNYDYPMTAQLQIGGAATYTSGRVWAFDQTSPAITERAPIAAISGNQFNYEIPPLTVCHIVLDAQR